MNLNVTDQQCRLLYQAVRLACYHLAGELPGNIGTVHGEIILQQISDFNKLANDLKLNKTEGE